MFLGINFDVDYIFVLSAIAPVQMKFVVQRIWEALRPGGMVLLRDYAQNDICYPSVYFFLLSVDVE